MEKKFTEGMERAQRLIDEIAEVIKAQYPDYSDAQIMIECDGHATLSVMKWGKYKNSSEVDHTKRRYLAESNHYKDGKWRAYDHESMNRYLESVDLLLKEA